MSVARGPSWVCSRDCADILNVIPSLIGSSVALWWQPAYLVTVGYGLALVFQTLWTYALLQGPADGKVRTFDLFGKSTIPLAHIHLLLQAVHGAWLAGFLLFRDKYLVSFRARALHDLAVAAAYSRSRLYAMWIGFSIMYTLIYISAYYTVCHKNAGMNGASLGLQMMFFGLVCEIWGDLHKAWSKSVRPHRYCSGGIYNICRHPNLFGEMIFWWGSLLNSFYAWHGLPALSLSLFGTACINASLFFSALRHHNAALERYRHMPDFIDYIHNVPLLWPLDAPLQRPAPPRPPPPPPQDIGAAEQPEED